MTQYKNKLESGEKNFCIIIDVKNVPFKYYEDVARYFVKFCKESNIKYNADISVGLPPAISYLWEE